MIRYRMVFGMIFVQVGWSGTPKHMKFSLPHTIFNPVEMYVYGFGVFFWMVSLVMQLVAELLVSIGVTGCGWSIYSRVWQRRTAVFAFSKKAPISASEADAIIFHNIFQRERISPFWIRV